jgi:hypothetical protein
MGTIVGTGYNTLNFSSTSFGDPALLLRNGLQYNPNLLYASNLDLGIRPTPGQIDTPSPWIDPNGEARCFWVEHRESGGPNAANFEAGLGDRGCRRFQQDSICRIFDGQYGGAESARVSPVPRSVIEVVSAREGIV